MNDTSKFWEDLKSGHFVSLVKESSKGNSLQTALEVYNIMKPLFAEVDDIELFYCIYLDSKNRIIAIEKMFSGSISKSVVYPREIIKRIIALKSNAVIITHNHPSGDPEPSNEDKRITVQLWVALKSIEVTLHDHIIVGDGYHSLGDEGFIGSIQSQFNNFMRSSL
jgi:DNA repair protein RadC